MTPRTRDEVYSFDRFKLLILLLLLAALLLAVFYGNRLGLNNQAIGSLPQPTAAAIVPAEPTPDEPPAIEPTAVPEPAPTELPAAEPTPTEPQTGGTLIAEVPLALTSPVPGSEIAAGLVAFAGTGAPGSTVRVLSNGRVLGDAVVDAGGNWSLEATLPAGTPAITLQALDQTGNPVVVTEAAPLAVTGAAVPGVNLPTTEVVAGPVVLTGTGEPGARLNVVLNGALVGSVTVDENGNWQVPTTLSGGSYELLVQRLDEAGLVVAESNPAPIVISGEAAAAEPTTEPVTVTQPETETTPAEGPGSFDPLVSSPVVYGAAAAGTTAQLLLDGRLATSAAVDVAGRYLLPLPLDSEATIIQVRLLDAAGQVISTTEPIAQSDIVLTPSVELPGSPLVLPAGATSWQGRGTPGTRVEVVVNGQVAGIAVIDEQGDWLLSLPLSAGAYTLRLNALDADGGFIAGSSAVEFSVQ